MDVYCIERGNLLDAPTIQTLIGPDKHSVHCLVDVDRCTNSGFEILADALTVGGVHGRAYRLDDHGNKLVLSLARSTGSCSTCTGVGQKHGFRATIKGTVTTQATDTRPAVVGVSSVLPSSAGCPSGNSVPANTIFATATNGPYYLAHGSLMLIAWGALLPSGVITAHFLKHRPNALWFKIHRAAQITGLLIAIIAWIIALSRFSVFGGKANAASIHGGLGMTVMTLGILQPVNAFLRPHVHPDTPKTKGRVYWENLHKGSGYTAVCLAVLTVVLGTTLLPDPGDQIAFQIMYGVVVVCLISLLVWMKRDANTYDKTPQQ